MLQVGFKGCAFHWTQAVFRRIKAEALSGFYLENDTVRSLLREVLYLPYLPEEDIKKTLDEIKDDVRRWPKEIGGECGVKGRVMNVVDYVMNYWVEGPWCPADWSVFGLQVRTNNDVEGWHHGLNKMGVKPTMYILIQRLKDMSTSAALDCQFVREGKSSRKQRREHLQHCAFVEEQWKRFIIQGAGGISARTLIRSIGRNVRDIWERWATEN